MNNKKLNTLILIAIFFASCSGSGSPSRRSQVYNIASDSDQVPYVNNEEENTLMPLEINDNYPQIEERDEVKQQVVEEPVGSLKTKKFYCGLLDGFCKKFFDRKFAGTHYIPGSINVDNVSEFDSNTVIVKGTHSFKSPIILRNNKEFKATIREDGYNRFHINFQRYGVRLGDLKSTDMLPFYYNPEE